MLDLAEKFKPNVEDGTVPYHSKSGLEHAKYGQLWLFYDGFCAASAGGVQGTARLAGQVTGALTASILLSAVSVNLAAPIAFAIAALAALSSAAISWSNDHR